VEPVAVVAVVSSPPEFGVCVIAAEAMTGVDVEEEEDTAEVVAAAAAARAAAAETRFFLVASFLLAASAIAWGSLGGGF